MSTGTPSPAPAPVTSVEIRTLVGFSESLNMTQQDVVKAEYKTGLETTYVAAGSSFEVSMTEVARRTTAYMLTGVTQTIDTSAIDATDTSTLSSLLQQTLESKLTGITIDVSAPTITPVENGCSFSSNTICASLLPNVQCRWLCDLYQSTSMYQLAGWGTGWGNGRNPCSTGSTWAGTTCGVTYVERLKIPYQSLQGTLPNSLVSLVELDLKGSMGQISGSIPSSIVSMTSLRKLLLDHSKQSGKVPEKMGSLTALDSLDIAHSEVSGSIPEGVFDAKWLQYLGVSFTKLSGTMSYSFGTLANVNSISYQEMPISGTVPSHIGLLTSLLFKAMSLRKIRVSGTMPSLSRWPDFFDTLYIYNVFISGTLPQFPVGEFIELDKIVFGGTALSGELGQNLAAHTKLKKFALR